MCPFKTSSLTIIFPFPVFLSAAAFTQKSGYCHAEPFSQLPEVSIGVKPSETKVLYSRGVIMSSLSSYHMEKSNCSKPFTSGCPVSRETKCRGRIPHLRILTCPPAISYSPSSKSSTITVAPLYARESYISFDARYFSPVTKTASPSGLLIFSKTVI